MVCISGGGGSEHLHSPGCRPYLSRAKRLGTPLGLVVIGEKCRKKMDSISTTDLDEVLANSSGYLAIDEVYDGPFCILSVVDNRRYNRLAFRVLEHDPAQDDVRAFLREFKGQLDGRGLSVLGITTDGSSLYPTVLKELWPKARHQ